MNIIFTDVYVCSKAEYNADPICKMFNILQISLDKMQYFLPWFCKQQNSELNCSNFELNINKCFGTFKYLATASSSALLLASNDSVWAASRSKDHRLLHITPYHKGSINNKIKRRRAPLRENTMKILMSSKKILIAYS